jgi:sugar phosphate isomerase/epimerase
MNLTLSTLACPDWTLPQIVGACAAAGVRGIDLRGLGSEIDVTRLPEFTTEIPQTLSLLREHGVQLPCFQTSVTLVSPAPQRWQEMLDEAHRHAALAAKTNTPYLRVFGGGYPKGMSQDEALSMAQRHLRQLVKICKPHNTLPLLETHDAWATSRAVRELLHELGPDEVGVLWDIEHTCRAGEAPGDTAESLRPYVRHVHFKDSIREDGKNVPRLLGEGDLPLADFARALKAMNYTGWICLETERRWHPETAPSPEVSIPHFVKFTTALFA